MPWNLEIHHIDVSIGDSTLIVARQVGTAVFRTVLIDGGLVHASTNIDNYLTGIGINRIDVVIVTHYDKDHVNGMRQLLDIPDPRFNNALIFDQGWPGNGGVDNIYLNYVAAINKVGTRTRITRNILSYTPAPNIHLPNLQNQPSWLVGDEVMWTNNAGAPDATTYGGIIAPGAVGGPPSLMCIAANGYIHRAGAGPLYINGGLNPNSAEGRNGRSLAFLLTFENFRYYIGGDIQTLYEDNPDPVQQLPSIGSYLASVGGVHAMKASHHGAGESSPLRFITRLNPRAAFISSGIGNNYGGNPATVVGGPWPKGHPQQRVLQDLQGRANLVNYYLTNDRSNEDFCRRINIGIGAWPLAYTAKARVAGGWGAPGADYAPAPGNPSPCGGSWPNDGAPGIRHGDIRVNITNGNTPAFAVTYSRPVITFPTLTAPLTLPGGVTFPNGFNFPAGVIFPNGAFTPTIQSNVQGYRLAADTDLPAGFIWGPNINLPNGTMLPNGTTIPPGLTSNMGLEEGETLMDDTVLNNSVRWPNNIVLPAHTILPGQSLFPPNTLWPANQAMPAFTHLAPFTWPNDRALPAGTIIPNGTTIPAGVSWPNGVALPGAAMVNTTINH